MGMYRGQIFQVRGMYRGRTLQAGGMYRGVPTKENLSCCYYVGRVRVRVGAYAYLGENPKFLNETAA